MNTTLQEKYCRFCLNATVDSELSPDNDFSAFGIGNTEHGYNMYFRTGYKEPTAITVSRWDEKLARNVDVGKYIMKFCPECGRKLIGNEKVL